MLRRTCAAVVLVVACVTPGVVSAQATPEPAVAPRAQQSQGIAVVAGPGVRDEAFLLARTLYATHLRPRRLDETRARILAGEPLAEGARPEAREAAELRAAVVGDDAASRSVLSTIARRTNAAALVVVFREAASPASDAGATGTPTPAPVVARLFLPETGDLDAARYAPEAPSQPGAAPSWRATVTSLEQRFPAPPSTAPAPEPKPQPFRPEPRKSEESKPFYTSPWLWGSLGAAALLGGIFYVASRDTSSQPIHLQVQLPR